MREEGKLKAYAIAAFLCTFLIASGASNLQSYELIVYARALFLAFALGASILILLWKGSVSRIATYTVLIIFLVAAIYFPRDDFPQRFVDATLFSSSAVFLAYFTSSSRLSDKVILHDLMILFVLAYILLLFFVSSISFNDGIPIITYSLQLGEHSLATYSQGVSKIFSVGVIAAVFKIVHEKRPLPQNLLFSLLILVFFMLSLAGGSRGEVIVCLFTIVAILSRSLKSFLLGSVCLGFVVIAMNLLIGDFERFEMFPTVWRLLYLIETSNLGSRDELLMQSLSLLVENPRCAIVGCGINYFQEYYSYDFGKYPHNWAAEFVVSFGLILFIAVIALAATFIIRNYKGFSNNEKFLMILSLYFFGVALKSGSILEHPLLYGSFLPVLFSARGPVESSSVPPKDRFVAPPSPRYERDLSRGFE